MYYRFTLIIILLFSSIYCFSQTDAHWFVTHANNESFSSKISFTGIGYPDYEERSRDDIFVIFKDGSFYNSRYVEPKIHKNFDNNLRLRGNYFYNGMDLKLKFPTDKYIMYLYQTDVYDTGEIPPGLSISGSSNNNNIINTINPSDLLSEKIISVNHDVTRESDIVLIMYIKSGKDYTLKYSKIIDNNGNSTTASIFEPSNVFSGNPYLGQISNPNITNDSFSFHSDSSGFVFLCLKPTAKIDLFLPNNDNNKNRLRFEFSNESKESWDHDEEILWAHDPNIIEATEICHDKNCNKYVKYSLRFSNDVEFPISNYKAKISFPFDYRSVRINTSTVNGIRRANPEIIREQDMLIFKWEGNTDFKMGRDPTGRNPKNGLVTLDFCVQKSDDSIDLENVNLSADGEVFFGELSKKLEKEDLVCTYNYVYSKKTKEIPESKLIGRIPYKNSLHYVYVKLERCSRHFSNCNSCEPKVKSDNFPPTIHSSWWPKQMQKIKILCDKYCRKKRECN